MHQRYIAHLQRLAMPYLEPPRGGADLLAVQRPDPRDPEARRDPPAGDEHGAQSGTYDGEEGFFSFRRDA